jgi:hypothetical protein
MTDKQLLELLCDFYQVQQQVALHMMEAIDMFDQGKEVPSWYCLICWCEARDLREEFWKKFKHYYPDAMALKEGVIYDYY